MDFVVFRYLVFFFSFVVCVGIIILSLAQGHCSFFFFDFVVYILCVVRSIHLVFVYYDVVVRYQH